MLILGIDTATEARSVAIARDEQVVAAHVLEGGRDKASAPLLSEIDRILKRAGTPLKSFDLFAVTSGPGRFTGLRAGLATIKAFAVAFNRPVVGVPTLQIVAGAVAAATADGGESIISPPVQVMAVIPAGRREFFAQLLAIGAGGTLEELTSPAHIVPELLFERAAQAAGHIEWAGWGAHQLSGQLQEAAAARGILWRQGAARAQTRGATRSWGLAPLTTLLAVPLVKMALNGERRGSAAAVAASELRAIYVRRPDAEMKEQCHRASNSHAK